MKARKRDSNDEWKDIAYVQLKDSYCLTSVDQMEFQHDSLSTELKTYDQVDEEKHWQDVRERAAIAAMQSLIREKYDASDGYLFASSISVDAVEYANELVKKLKGE